LHDETRHGPREKAGAGTDSDDQGESVMGQDVADGLWAIYQHRSYAPGKGPFLFPNTVRSTRKEAVAAFVAVSVDDPRRQPIWAAERKKWPIFAAKVSVIKE